MLPKHNLCVISQPRDNMDEYNNGGGSTTTTLYNVDRTTTAGNALGVLKKKKNNSWLEPKVNWNVETYGTFLSIPCNSGGGS